MLLKNNNNRIPDLIYIKSNRSLYMHDNVCNKKKLMRKKIFSQLRDNREKQLKLWPRNCQIKIV